jgi:hypothetical protein
LDNSISYSKAFLNKQSNLKDNKVDLFSMINNKKIERTKQFLKEIDEEDSRMQNLDIFLDDIVEFNNQIKELNDKFLPNILDSDDFLWNEKELDTLFQIDNIDTAKNSTENLFNNNNNNEIMKNSNTTLSAASSSSHLTSSTTLPIKLISQTATTINDSEDFDEIESVYAFSESTKFSNETTCEFDLVSRVKCSDKPVRWLMHKK